MQNKSPAIVHSGLSLVLVIFIVLCLAVFSALSLVTARSDYVLAVQDAGRSLAVQEAENQAQLWIARMDDCLAGLYALADSERAYREAIAQSDVLEDYYTAAADANRVSGAAAQTDSEPANTQLFEDLGILTASFPVSEGQCLFVELTLCPPSDRGFYTVTQWAVENTGDWEGDSSIPVYVEETAAAS